jgi:glycosyltransferase involved in cell wall biosynthesis
MRLESGTNKMNILILNTHNPLKASGIVALDLFNQFKGRGHEVKLLVNSYDKDYPDGIISLESAFVARQKLFIEKIEWRLNKLKQFLNIKDKIKTDPNYPFFRLNEKKQIYSTRKILNAAGPKPDTIIILFAKGFINAKNIYEMHKFTSGKIFWLMFDMAPFTGGCHYAWECKGYQMNCGNCPGLYSSDPLDISHKNLLFKKEFFDKVNIHVLAGSEWQYQQASMSTLFKNKPIHKILLSVDSFVFRPIDTKKLKSDMNISENKKIIFFGSVGLTEKRKGMHYLIKSLNKLREILKSDNSDLEKNLLLLVAGRGFYEIVDLLPFESRYLGLLDNNYGIASAYQVADVFICPSIEDSGPMMINQSIMSGTPVVSFEMGVSLDLVITGETGYRANNKDSNSMAQGIYSILSLNSDDYHNLSMRCRDLALKKCSSESRIELLEGLIKNAGSN